MKLKLKLQIASFVRTTAAATILASGGLLATAARGQVPAYVPVSPNTNWAMRMNGGGFPTGMPKTAAGELFDKLGESEGLSSGNMEEDRRAIEAWKRKRALEDLQLRIEKERRRRAAESKEQPLPTPPDRGGSASPSVKDLVNAKQQAEEMARRYLRAQLSGKTPTMSADTTAEWERQIWKANQHLLKPAE